MAFELNKNYYFFLLQYTATLFYVEHRVLFLISNTRWQHWGDFFRWRTLKYRCADVASLCDFSFWPRWRSWITVCWWASMMWTGLNRKRWMWRVWERRTTTRMTGWAEGCWPVPSARLLTALETLWTAEDSSDPGISTLPWMFTPSKAVTVRKPWPLSVSDVGFCRSHSGKKSNVFVSAPGAVKKEVYFMAIIDILTHYDAKKKAAHAAKTVKHGVSTHSH